MLVCNARAGLSRASGSRYDCRGRRSPRKKCRSVMNAMETRPDVDDLHGDKADQG